MPELTAEEVEILRQNFLNASPEVQAQALKDDPDVFGRFTSGGASANFELPEDQESDPMAVMFGAALPLVGAGLGTLTSPVTGPVGPIAGAMLGGTAGNLVLEGQGVPTEAIPFTGKSTGDPVMDAIISESLVPLAAAKQTARAFKIGRTGFGTIAGKLFRSNVDEAFVKSAKVVQAAGDVELPVFLAQKGVSPGMSVVAQFLFAAGKKKEAALQTTRALEKGFKNIYKVDPDDLDTAENIVSGAVDGQALAKTAGKLSNLGEVMPTVTRNQLHDMVRFREHSEQLGRSVDTARELLISSLPKNLVLPTSVIDLGRSLVKEFRGSATLSPAFRKVTNDIAKLLPDRKPASPSKLLDPRGNIVKATATGEEALEITDKRSFLNTLEQLEQLVESVDIKNLNTQERQVRQIYKEFFDSSRQAFLGQLDDVANSRLDDFINLGEQFNEIPSKLIREGNTGDILGFLETATTTPGAGRALRDVVGDDRAASFAGEYLISKAMRADGTIDFEKVSKLAKGESRAGIRELLGSDKMGLLTHFAEVAKNTSINNTFRNTLFYSTGLGGTGFGLVGGMGALPAIGQGIALTLGVNQFLKHIVFNPKIGRVAAQLTKLPPGSREARRLFNRIIVGTNGIRFTLKTIGANGELVDSQEVINRGLDGNKDPILENVESDVMF